MSDHLSQDISELFLGILSNSSLDERSALGQRIMECFGDDLSDDELEIVILYCGPANAGRAAELLFKRTNDPRALGIIAKCCPEYEGRAWQKVQEVLSGVGMPGEVFLGFCPRIRASVRESEYRRKYPHLH